jgi:peroxiredoxin
MMLEQGDTAPNVTFATPDGDRSVAGYQGRKLVLYFYPKDDTSGCTKEAQEFTALAGDFAAAGTTVVGISKDSIASHTKFATKYDLKVNGGLIKGALLSAEKESRYFDHIQKQKIKNLVATSELEWLDRSPFHFWPQFETKWPTWRLSDQ